jgi:dynein heavy chain
MTVVQEDAVLSNLPDNKDQILPNFLHANALLTEIQRHLDDYLDDKCQSFPRFYFLAADDLLKILAQTKDPTLVQPHMGKCFEGIKSVVFKGSLVTGMNSAEKEHVKFTSPIDVEAGDKKGKVEVWMLEIEEMMKTTLKNLTKAALEDFKTKPR